MLGFVVRVPAQPLAFHEIPHIANVEAGEGKELEELVSLLGCEDGFAGDVGEVHHTDVGLWRVGFSLEPHLLLVGGWWWWRRRTDFILMQKAARDSVSYRK